MLYLPTAHEEKIRRMYSKNTLWDKVDKYQIVVFLHSPQTNLSCYILDFYIGTCTLNDNANYIFDTAMLI